MYLPMYSSYTYSYYIIGLTSVVDQSGQQALDLKSLRTSESGDELMTQYYDRDFFRSTI